MNILFLYDLVAMAGQNDTRKQYYRALIISVLCLLIPAFYNGYPLVNPDTATYLSSGFKPETPFDRPITYGLLVRLFSLNGWSLWPVIFVQGLLTATLLFGIVKRLAGERPYIRAALIIVIMLSLCTGLSWVVCQVEPDIFTPVAFLCIILLLTRKGRGAALYTLFFIAVATHISNPMMMAGMLVCLFLVRGAFAGSCDPRRMKRTVIVMLVLSAASISIMGAAIAKSTHVFLMGSFVEKGLAKRYLDEQCPTTQYRLCAYKDQLPATLNEFMWDNNSPLYKVGDWRGTKKEFNAIIHDIFTTPRYLGWFLAAGAKATVQQAMLFDIGDGNQAFPPGAALRERVAEYIPHETERFDVSRQNRGTLLAAFVSPNKLFPVVMLFSAVGVWFIWFRRRYLSAEFRLIALICVGGALLNAADCAVFSCVAGRYGCRMMWLLPFCALLYGLVYKDKADTGKEPAATSR